MTGKVCTEILVTGLPEKSARYENIPFRAELPAIPEFPSDFEPCASDEAIRLIGVYTRKIKLASLENATDALLRCYRHRVEQGDRRALGELLDLNPAFILKEWVAEMVTRYTERKLPIRRAGRPRGTYDRDRLYVFGIVEHLVRSQRTANKEWAFRWLSERWHLSYERIKALYYEASNDSRVRAPILVTRPVGVGSPSSEEQVNSWLAQAEWPPEKPAAIITRVGVRFSSAPEV